MGRLYKGENSDVSVAHSFTKTTLSFTSEMEPPRNQSLLLSPPSVLENICDRCWTRWSCRWLSVVLPLKSNGYDGPNSCNPG